MNLLRWAVFVLVLASVRVFAGEPATAVATVTAGFVSGIAVTSGGSGYRSEPVVTITGGGGSGATAKAILSGDRVAVVLVLTAGNGYTSAPAVAIEAPTKSLGLVLEMVPKLTVEGPPGSLAQVEWSIDLSGPWTAWSNVVVGAEGLVLVDLRPASVRRFYRAVRDERPLGPANFVWIAPGAFVMGSPQSEPFRNPDEVQHTVTLTKGFWLSDHEVTQAEYLAVVGINPSEAKGDLNRPVEKVSWDDAVAYCQKLTERERVAGRLTMQQAYRLPTEAEWEYAARAGTTGARYGELDAIGWYDGNSGNQTHAVKQKMPNSWGLYDMLGNVFEWCLDAYGLFWGESVTDPVIPPPTGYAVRIARGGTAMNGAGLMRSAYRYADDPGRRHGFLGFRPALSSVR